MDVLDVGEEGGHEGFVEEGTVVVFFPVFVDGCPV